MSQKVYRSNISPYWTRARQDALLPKDGTPFEDEITKSERRSKNPDHLNERREMLRPTTRSGVKRIVVAALPCLAYDSDDFIFVLKQAAQIEAEIHVCEPKIVFAPSKAYTALHRAARLFKDAKNKLKGFEGGTIGGQIMGEKKKEISKGKSSSITKEMWGDPEITNAELCELSGLSINTLRRIFEPWGTRFDAIKRTKAAQKRKAKQEAK